jgi:Heparinase II/III-like protein
MKSALKLLFRVLLLITILVPSLRAAETLDPDRVREITAMLPPHAVGVGQPITNRAAWKDAAAHHPEWGAMLILAYVDAKKPLPALPDSLYLEFSRNGNRTHYQSVASSRNGRIAVFTLAECLEDKGRFIAPLEQTIAAICAERTWVLPAHDAKLQNFNGTQIDIELDSSFLGAELANVDYLLGDHLSPATRKLIHDNLQRRIFTPFHDAATGVRPEFWWMRANNNWNAVCYDGVVGAALAAIDSPEERAWYIAVAEKNVGNYLDGGFTPDGYCVEGLGYWNYGFGNFINLSENIREATGGKLDLLADPKVAQPALFGVRSEIFDGVHTSIADCDPDGRPSPLFINFLSRRFNLDSSAWPKPRLSGSLYFQLTMAFLPQDLPVIHAPNDFADLPWRTWFPDSSVLICRPGSDAKIPFAVAIKGGNNGVNHGHHDVGSFSVVVGTNMVICDPGGEVYTERTFSPQRYESEVLNSFGHAVPIVAGRLQRNGATAHAVVLSTNFTADADTLVFDLRSAYPVKDLQKLKRSFVFQRGQSPSLEVRDEISFAEPENYESALITWGTIQRIGDNELEISDGGGTVRVKIDAQGHPFHLRQEAIHENTENHRTPIHLGIVLDDKISSATITLKISPVTK